MAHLRKRLILDVFKKQLRFWPIVTLLGPRQSGKSTFLRDLAFKKDESHYVSLDRIAIRKIAKENPESFLNSQAGKILIIDEAHKVPGLFDEIKAEVDESRRPGQFVLTGSVRFSRKIGIRESFTGRSCQLQMDSLCLKETIDEKPNLNSLLRYLDKGGMPGVCFLRDTNQIENYWQEWLETVCYRDLTEYSKSKLTPEIAFSCLEGLATIETPDITHLAKKLRVDSRIIKNHLQALKDLFVIHERPPTKESFGKSHFLLFDTGLAHFFKAPIERRMETAIFHELRNRQIFLGKKFNPIHHHRTRRGSYAPFVTESDIFVWTPEPTPSKRLLMSVKAILKNYPNHKVKILTQSDHLIGKIEPKIHALPIASLFS